MFAMEIIIYILLVLLTAVIVSAIFFGRISKLRRHAFEVEKECEFARRELETAKAVHERELSAKDIECGNLLAERERFVAETFRTLKEQFVNLSVETLNARSGELSQKNREEISNLLTPLRQQLEAFASSATAAQKTNEQIGTAIKTQIESIRLTAANLGQQAEGLASALRGGSKVQGAWGEEVLAHVLKASGLQENIHFFCQKGESGVGIPDVQVLDPTGRVMLVDSKVSLTDYLRSCNAQDDRTRQEALADHVKSIKRQIDMLAKKEYVRKFKSANPDKMFIEVVAMFMPNDACFAAAVATDATVVNYAAERNIIIVTPVTLMSYLRLVSHAWQYDCLDKNNDKIIEQARILLGRVDGCVGALEKMREHLLKADAEYENVMGLLGRREGKLSMVKPAQELVNLGVRLAKSKSALIGRFGGEA